MARRPARGLAFWGAVGATGVLGLFALNVAADRFGGKAPGLSSFRDYVVRRNG
jgi:hypothetical protein